MQEVLDRARARQQERPDIHTAIVKPPKPQPYADNVSSMLADLIEQVPGISNRQLSQLTGIHRQTIADLLDEPISNFETCSAALLELLRLCHPGRCYEDDIRAINECDVSGFIHIASFCSPHDPATYKADQSHTIKRPITLPTKPFDWRN
jgi:lambda repressor-like predicted transcriptional regulator